MPDITIGDKAVVLRDSIAAAAVWKILPHLFSIGRGDNIFLKIPWDIARLMVMESVESWEFEGDPHDEAFYDSLTPAQITDLFMPLVMQVFTHITTLVNETGEASGE